MNPVSGASYRLQLQEQLRSVAHTSEYSTQVLTYEELGGRSLIWEPNRGQVGIAWRVVGPRGEELAIYDSACIANDVRNNLNTRNVIR